MATNAKVKRKKTKSTGYWIYWPEIISLGYYMLILFAGLYAQAHM